MTGILITYFYNIVASSAVKPAFIRKAPVDKQTLCTGLIVVCLKIKAEFACTYISVASSFKQALYSNEIQVGWGEIQ